MKSNWFTSTIVVLALSSLAAKPLGLLYESLTHSSASSFFNLDPNHLVSGFTMGLILSTSFLAGTKHKLLLLMPFLAILLFDLWLESYYDIRFDVVAGLLGLTLGVIYRRIFLMNSVKTKVAGKKMAKA